MGNVIKCKSSHTYKFKHSRNKNKTREPQYQQENGGENFENQGISELTFSEFDLIKLQEFQELIHKPNIFLNKNQVFQTSLSEKQQLKEVDLLVETNLPYQNLIHKIYPENLKVTWRFDQQTFDMLTQPLQCSAIYQFETLKLKLMSDILIQKIFENQQSNK